MKTLSLFSVLSFCFVLVSCSKDKFETTPYIEIKEYNTKELPAPVQGDNPELVITIKFSDKQGDIGQGELSSERVRLNTIGVPVPGGEGRKPDDFTGPVPEFSDKTQGEIIFRVRHSDLAENRLVNDTLQFRFALRDRGNNTSDTILTDQIVVIRP